MADLQGWSRGTWGEGDFGEFIPVSVTGEQSNTSVGTLTITADALVLPTGVSSGVVLGTAVGESESIYPLTGVQSNTSTGAVSIGEGIELVSGVETAIITYGPLNLSTSLTVVKKSNIGLINFPWLNEINNLWLKKISYKYKKLFFIESQYSKISLSTLFAKSINHCGLDLKIFNIPIEDFPPCGSEAEVLKKMNFDELSISKTISKIKSI